MTNSLQTLLEGIYSSVLEARKFVNDQHLKSFESYFEKRLIQDPDTKDIVEVYAPRLVSVATSKGVGKDETFEIIDAPVMTLIPLSTLAIDTLEFEFDAKLAGVQAAKEKDDTEDQLAKAVEDTRNVLRRTIDDLLGAKGDIEIMPKGDNFESSASKAHVRVTFKMHEPPEGAHLIQEQLLDYLRQT